MSDRAFRVEFKLRNNALIKARERLGYATCKSAAKALDLQYLTLNAYEALKMTPWSKRNGDWRPSAMTIAKAYGVVPEELWPEVIRKVTRTRAEIEIDAPTSLVSCPPDPFEILAKNEDHARLTEAMAYLSPEETQLVELRFGLGDEAPLSQHDLSKRFGHCRATMYNATERALNKLRAKVRHG